MPHELPAVTCSLLHSSAEVPLDKLTEAAEEASHGRLGRQWNTDEHCPCLTPVGAALQAAHKDLGKVNFTYVTASGSKRVGSLLMVLVHFKPAHRASSAWPKWQHGLSRPPLTDGNYAART